MGKPRIITRPTPVLRKQIGVMRKLFGLWGDSKKSPDDNIKNKAYPQPEVKVGVPDFLNQTRGLTTTYTTRRQIVLNRHFTEIISDYLSNNLKKQLDSMGVTITSIETKAWNKGVTVFYSTPNEYDQALHIELNSLVGQLRYTVTERRLIGRTPNICFAYDKSIKLDRVLDKALEQVSHNGDDVGSRLATIEKNQLWVAKNLGSHEEKLISKKFSAPGGMDNTMCGLNYPHFYDEVVLKLERGRGDTSRMNSSSGVFAYAQPLFKAPSEDQGIEDPATRILKMKKFMVSQKMKGEALARSKRKAELLARDRFKWDLPENEEQGDEIEETIHEERR